MTNPWKEPYQDLREAVSPFIDPKTGKPITDFKTAASLNVDTTRPLNRYGAGQLPAVSYGSQTPTAAAFNPPARVGTPTQTPAPQKPIPATASSATTSKADKIKSGMDIYKQQIKSGDVKGAEETGKNISALKYGTPEERKAKTIGTRNPLMDKTFGYQTGQAPIKKESKEVIKNFLVKEGYIN